MTGISILLCLLVTASAGELHDAVYRDDLAAVKKLVQGGADVNEANRYGVTPLSLACTNGDTPLIELLLRAGANPNQEVPGGETPIMTAARTGKPDAVKALLAHGANVQVKEGRRGQTPLMWAAAEGHTEVVASLIGAGADFRARLDSGFSAFLFAVREGRIGVVQALIKAGADVNETVQPSPGAARRPGAPRPGTSALHLAVTNAHYELALRLLEAGADPNAAENGWTVLHLITGVRKPGGGDNNPAPLGSGSVSSLDFVVRLKEHGANLNARMTKRIGVGMTSLNTLGATPFMLAARSADAELMRLLAKLGADPSLGNADNSTPLMAAAGLGTRSPGEDAGTESEVVEALQVALELGADIDAVDKNGETAMHGAAYKNLPGAVRFLAEHKARIEIWNRPNRFGWSPLRIAEGYRFGNYKPSSDTVIAIQKILFDAGVAPVVATGGNRSSY